MSRATTRCTVLAAAVLGGILWAVPAQAATGHGADAPKAAPASADDFVWPTPPARPLDFVWPTLPQNLPGIPSSPDDFVWPVTPQR
ncbi:hypothetical protein ACFCWG_16410 [Streptomyces sp. NPDC056390]|uniref:hypothetical protein n=1 Tax=Streptomyces sp. NPDC056390 TaxID=3345806 RepID=UPI0035E12A8A